MKNNGLHNWHKKCFIRSLGRADLQSGVPCSMNHEEAVAMNAISGVSVKVGLLTSGAMLAMLAFAPYAHASPVRINFSGAAGSGYVDLTLSADPDSSTNYQPTFNQNDADNHVSRPLSIYDPAGAQHITGASGNFWNGSSNVSITGMIATSPGVAPPGEILPKSFSGLFADGLPQSYDNLFYANGSPLVCPPMGAVPYTFHGGFLDIFGAMFAMDNGDVVGLWSDGVVPAGVFGTAGGVTYGLSLFSPTIDGGYTVMSSQFAGATATATVPEPDFLWLFGAGVLGFFAWRRSAEFRKATRVG
ncbi:MAG: PEP-CTERM sorting domain-containing protein [Rhodanobacter sp.]